MSNSYASNVPRIVITPAPSFVSVSSARLFADEKDLSPDQIKRDEVARSMLTFYTLDLPVLSKKMMSVTTTDKDRETLVIGSNALDTLKSKRDCCLPSPS